MKTYWVDFSGYLKIEAENEQEAEQKFWNWVNNTCEATGDLTDDVWDIDGIEETVE